MIWSRLKNTFRGTGHRSEIEEEIQFHLAMKERDGYNRRETRMQFGNVRAVREETRAAGMFGWLESLGKDARHSFRSLRKAPAIAAAVVLSLGVGIGVNTGIFSLVDAALLKNLPVKDPQSLLLIHWQNKGWPEALCEGHIGDTDGDPPGILRGSSVSPRTYRQLAAEQKGYSLLIGFSDAGFVGVTSHGKPAEQSSLQYVSANFFEGLGVPLHLGPGFRPGDDRVGQEPAVVISDRFWKSYLSGEADVLGKMLRVNGVAVRIVGVAPPRFFGVQIGEWVDLYTPLAARTALSPDARQARAGESDSTWWVRQMARLKPGSSPQRAQMQLSNLFQRFVVPEGVKVDRAKIPHLISERAPRGFDPIGVDESRALWILFLLVHLTLLIACANVANLLLARAVAREREAAVCLALGAPRRRIVQQQMAESIILAIGGGALGVTLGYAVANGLHLFVIDSLHISGFDLHLNASVLAYTLAISLLTAVLFGSAPSLRLGGVDVNQALKAQSRSVLGGGLRFSQGLVGLQMALSLVVLVCAGSLGRSLSNLKRINIGFNGDNLVYVSVNPWKAGYKAEQVGPYVGRLRDGLSAIGGVREVGLISQRPLSGAMGMMSVCVPGRPFLPNADQTLVNEVSDRLFEALQLPLIAGRTFRPQDLRAGSKAVIVDQLFVKKYFPGSNGLGMRFGNNCPKPTELYEIIGVVGSSRYHSLRREQLPIMYRPLINAEIPGGDVNFAVRTILPSRQLAYAARGAAATIDPGVPVVDFQTQTSLIDHILFTDRLLTIVSGAFGVLALTLSAAGLAGLLLYVVAQRQGEIGIRMALGAMPSDVVGMVMRDSFRLLSLGVLIGLPGALLVGRVLKSVLFGLSAADPLTVLGSLLVLALAAVLAAFLPANRAARVHPASALRNE